MSIAAELIKLSQSARIELYVVDATNIGGSVHRFHAGTNGLRAAVVWQGEAYTPFPIRATGFDRSSSGTLPRPKVQVSNVLGLVGVLNRQYGNLEGARFVRKRTLQRFLDAVNFPGGTNPDADPSAGYPDDVWIIDRRSYQDNQWCEYELASPIDLAGVLLPGRQVIARTCMWQYRGPECGYTGGAVADANDQATSELTQDRCGHRLTSCLMRFGGDPDGLPFGGFPGAGVTRQV